MKICKICWHNILHKYICLELQVGFTCVLFGVGIAFTEIHVIEQMGYIIEDIFIQDLGENHEV